MTHYPERSGLTLPQRREHQAALRQYLANSDAEFFVTPQFNIPGLRPELARTYLRDFIARVERKLFGTRWAQFPSDKRLWFVAMPEWGKNEKLHYHLLLSVPNPHLREKFCRLAPRLLRDIVPTGDLDIRPVKTSLDRATIADYITKDAATNFSIEHYVFVHEFHNCKRQPRGNAQVNSLLQHQFRILNAACCPEVYLNDDQHNCDHQA